MAREQQLRQILELQCGICKAMAHPLRLEIVERLYRKEMPASALRAALEISKANLSKHMALLIHAGLVVQRKTGRRLHYSLADPEIHEACTVMRSVLYRRLKASEKVALAMRRPGGR